MGRKQLKELLKTKRGSTHNQELKALLVEVHCVNGNVSRVKLRENLEFACSFQPNLALFSRYGSSFFLFCFLVFFFNRNHFPRPHTNTYTHAKNKKKDHVVLVF